MILLGKGKRADRTPGYLLALCWSQGHYCLVTAVVLAPFQAIADPSQGDGDAWER